MNFIERSPQSLSKVRQLDYYMSRHKGFIAGGCFKNIFQGTQIKDLDIFFENEDDWRDAKDSFKDNDSYVFSYENKNTISYKNKRTNIRVELIRHTYGTPEQILSLFDFSITKFAYSKRDSNEGVEYYCTFVDTFFEDLTNNKLVIDGNIQFPVSTFERSYRYRSYGFGLCKESKGKLLESLQGANIDNLNNDLYFGID